MQCWFKFLKSVLFDLEPFCKSEERKNQYLPTAKKTFVQNAQKKRKNLFVRLHKKNGAFSKKENDAVSQKLFWETHFLQVAERKNDYLLTAKTILSIHDNFFSAWG